MTLTKVRSKAVLAAGMGIALAAVLLSGPSTSQIAPVAGAASADYFLKIDGIDGESKDDKHKGHIDIESWSWGMTQTGTSSTGGGGGAGKATFQDLHFTKRIDKATPKLLEACASGTHLREAVLDVPGPKGDDWYRITLSDVLCTSLGQSGSPTDAPVETLSLNYTKIMVEYKPAGSSTWERAGWDLALGKKI